MGIKKKSKQQTSKLGYGKSGQKLYSNVWVPKNPQEGCTAMEMIPFYLLRLC